MMLAYCFLENFFKFIEEYGFRYATLVDGIKVNLIKGYFISQ